MFVAVSKTQQLKYYVHKSMKPPQWACIMYSWSAHKERRWQNDNRKYLKNRG